MWSILFFIDLDRSIIRIDCRMKNIAEKKTTMWANSKARRAFP